MKVSFLFWNLRAQTATLAARQPSLLQSIARFAGMGVDVLLFAECTIDPLVVTGTLNGGGTGPYYHAISQSWRVLFFSRIEGAPWTDRFVDTIRNRITAQEVQAGNAAGILVVGAHLDPGNYQTLDDRAEWARDVAAEIRLLEKDVGHDRTILVGDLNMNPYDGGLMQTTALHAVMTRDLARSVQRLTAREKFPPFYNPMWSCFGDRRPGMMGRLPIARRPPGTYFFANPQARASPFWNLYDQVLLRPAPDGKPGAS